MVGGYLHHGKQGSKGTTCQITATVTKDNTGYGGRDVSQCHELPYMAGTDYDDEIGGKSIGNGPYQSYVPPHLHGQEKDEKSHHHHGYKRGRRG